MSSEFEKNVNPNEIETHIGNCRNAAIYARNCLLMQSFGLSIGQKTLNEQETEGILELLSQAQKGYRLYKKSSNFRVEFEKDMVRSTFFENKLNYGVWERVFRNNEELSPHAMEESFAFRTFKYTLDEFGHKGEIVFADFAILPDNLNLGELEFSPTYWSKRFDPEGVWYELKEIYEETCNMFFKPESVKNNNLLRIGHLFTAILNLTKQ